MNLEDYGWSAPRNTDVAALALPEALPGRILREYRHRYTVFTTAGILDAEVTGTFRHEHPRQEDFPAVGDWVALVPVPGEEKGRIHAVLPRKTAFIRPAPGRSSEMQVMAANVDTVFLVSGLDGDFNLRRIERYLTMAYDSGAMPVIVLNKCDLEADLPGRIAAVEAVAYGVPIHGVSSVSGVGLDVIQGYAMTGKTLVCLGSSGAGKSSLVNALLGHRVMETGDVREDDSRGRHTTTHRELFPLPRGGLIIDTPGIRELQVAGSGENLEAAFADVETYLQSCLFRDCTHSGERGCAIAEALERGDLEPGRFNAYQRLQREIAYTERRHHENYAHEEKKRTKAIGKLHKRIQNEKKNRR